MGNLLRMSAFLMASMLAQALYLLADMYWVGRLGRESVAAVGLRGQFDGFDASSHTDDGGGHDYSHFACCRREESGSGASSVQPIRSSVLGWRWSSVLVRFFAATCVLLSAGGKSGNGTTWHHLPRLVCPRFVSAIPVDLYGCRSPRRGSGEADSRCSGVDRARQLGPRINPHFWLGNRTPVRSTGCGHGDIFRPRAWYGWNVWLFCSSPRVLPEPMAPKAAIPV